MVELNPLKWSKEGTAKFIYETLDPIYGEGGVFEDVTEQVREGDLVGATIEATETVFVEPVIDYTVETVIEPVVDSVVATGLEYIDPIKEGYEGAKDFATIALAVGAVYILSKG